MIFWRFEKFLARISYLMMSLVGVTTCITLVSVLVRGFIPIKILMMFLDSELILVIIFAAFVIVSIAAMQYMDSRGWGKWLL